jgi:hypothetical protein
MRTGLCGLALASVLTAASGAAHAQTAGACDRACLLGIADVYFAALAAHDSAKAPLAPNAKFTEQAQVLNVGDGLWKTTTEGPTIFKIPVPDPVSGRISGGKIHEIEAMGFTLPLYSKNGWSPFLR